MSCFLDLNQKQQAHFKFLLVLISFSFLNAISTFKPNDYSINDTFFTYEIQIFNKNQDPPDYFAECEEVQSIKYTSSKRIDKVYVNDDKSSHLVSYVDQKTAVYQQSLVVIDNSFLYLFEFQNSIEYSEIFLKNFRPSLIEEVQPHWFYGRVYVRTQHGNFSEIYEIDLNLRLCAKMTQFESSDQVLMTADPFQGVLSLYREKRLFSINVMFVNEVDGVFVRNFSHLSLGEYRYSSFLLENSTSQTDLYDFKFMISSSTLIGQSTQQYYYMVNKNDLRFECTNNKTAYACRKLGTDVADKFVGVYNHYENKECNTPFEKTHKVRQTYKTQFNDTMYNQEFKSCLKVCQLPKWKQDFNTLMSNIDRTLMHCFNSLEFDSTSNGVEFQKLTDTMFLATMRDLNKLNSLFCNIYCLNLKYSIGIRLLKNQLDLMSRSYENVVYEANFDGVLFFRLREEERYELTLYLQTPFDNKPYRVGSYLVENNFPSSEELFTAHPEPYLINTFSDVLFENRFLTNDSIYLNLIFPENHYNYEDILIRNAYFILINSRTNETVTKKITSYNFINKTNNDILKERETKMRRIEFKIGNLLEDELYFVRILIEDETKKIQTLSKMYSFKTLSKPTFKLINLNDTKAYFQVKMTCNYYLQEFPFNSDMSEDEIRRTVISDFYIYRAEFSQEINNYTNWSLVYRDHTPELSPRILLSKVAGTTLITALIDKNLTLDMQANTNYKFQLKAEYYSFSILSETIYFKSHKTTTLIIQKNYVYLVLIILSCIIGFLLFLLGIFFLIVIKNDKLHKKLMKTIGLSKEDNVLENLDLLEKMNMSMLYAWTHPFKKKFLTAQIDRLNKIDEAKVVFEENIGKGAFGEVYRGVLIKDDKSKLVVAIKRLKADALDVEKLDLIKEAISLNSFNHPNLIKFHGICLDSYQPKFIVLEYMHLGDLLTYLREMRNLKNMTYRKAIRLSKDVAKGCEFLEKCKFVHRDIAARNCLVTSLNATDKETQTNENDILVKIGDFGLAREMYSSDYYKQPGDRLLPIRWMAPEAILDGIFTTQTDIWSFGVLLWEIMTLGRQPYAGMDNKEVIDLVIKKGSLKVPERCPTEILELINKCTSYESVDRPSFNKIAQILEFIINDNSSFKLDNIIELDEIYTTTTPTKSTRKKELKISLIQCQKNDTNSNTTNNTSLTTSNEYDDELNSSRYTSETGSSLLTFNNSIVLGSPSIIASQPTILESIPIKYTTNDYYNTDTDSTMSQENMNETLLGISDHTNK